MLLVEDHDLLAGTLTMALGSRGIQAESTSGPTPAVVLDAVRRLAPVLVLLDLDLGPLGSGLDLVRPIRDAGGRVVMLTGVTDRAQLGACLEAGARAVLSKADAFDVLVDAVTRLSRGEEVMGEAERQKLVSEAQARRASDRRRLAPFSALTPREQAVLARLVAGESAEAVAAASYVSLATVRSQIRSILSKLGVNSQLAAVAMARQAGWPDRPS